MYIKAIKTEKISAKSITLYDFLDKYIPCIQDNTVVAFSSKIISLIEDRVELSSADINKLISKEADYIGKQKNQFGRYLTVKYNTFISAAGIDQSNGNGNLILLPENPQKTAKVIYKYLSKKYNRYKFGVIICDSRSTLLRIGAIGVAIGFHGFSPLKSYVGKPDIFGRKFQFENANIADSLAATAVFAMGEGNEQTPIALIENIDSVSFSKAKPSKNELKNFYLSFEKDYFHQFYKNLFK